MKAGAPGWAAAPEFYLVKAEAPGWAVLGFLIHRNSETINVCCFNPLHFGAILCTAIGNESIYLEIQLKK